MLRRGVLIPVGLHLQLQLLVATQRQVVLQRWVVRVVQALLLLLLLHRLMLLRLLLLRGLVLLGGLEGRMGVLVVQQLSLVVLLLLHRCHLELLLQLLQQVLLQLLIGPGIVVLFRVGVLRIWVLLLLLPGSVTIAAVIQLEADLILSYTVQNCH